MKLSSSWRTSAFLLLIASFLSPWRNFEEESSWLKHIMNNSSIAIVGYIYVVIYSCSLPYQHYRKIQFSCEFFSNFLVFYLVIIYFMTPEFYYSRFVANCLFCTRFGTDFIYFFFIRRRKSKILFLVNGLTTIFMVVIVSVFGNECSHENQTRRGLWILRA